MNKNNNKYPCGIQIKSIMWGANKTIAYSLANGAKIRKRPQLELEENELD